MHSPHKCKVLKKKGSNTEEGGEGKKRRRMGRSEEGQKGKKQGRSRKVASESIGDG